MATEAVEVAISMVTSGGGDAVLLRAVTKDGVEVLDMAEISKGVISPLMHLLVRTQSLRQQVEAHGLGLHQVLQTWLWELDVKAFQNTVAAREE